MSSLTRYVCGFMFNEKYSHVLLIEKLKPVWQKGLINGIGGKVEKGEGTHEAMIREFREETGIHHENWNLVCDISGKDWTVEFNWAIGDIYAAKTMEEEQVIIEPVNRLPYNVIPNVRWLIPLAMDRSSDDHTILRNY